MFDTCLKEPAAARARGSHPATVLIVGGSPESSSPGLVADLARSHDVVVAVDRGLDALLAAGAGCDLFCGDADSVSERGGDLVRACEAGEEGAVSAVERYDPHKDDTDLGLALRAVCGRWPGAAIACTCVTGGRPDHALAVLGRLVAWEAGPVRIVEDGFAASILHGPTEESYEGDAGRTFSFIPLSPEAVVSERGMRWNLDHERVPLLSDLGVSNVIERDLATFTCHEGTVVAFLFSEPC